MKTAALIAVLAAITAVEAMAVAPRNNNHLANQNDHAKRVAQYGAGPVAPQRAPVHKKRTGKCRPRLASSAPGGASTGAPAAPTTTGGGAAVSSGAGVTPAVSPAESTGTGASPVEPTGTGAAPVSSGSSAAPSSGSSASPVSSGTESSGATTTTGTAPATSSSAATAQSGNTPNGIKAGISSGEGFDSFAPYIGWWYDWTPAPSGHSGKPVAVPMLWGTGHLGSDQDDATRYGAWQNLKADGQPFVIGFEEPDCSTEGSANFDVATGVSSWEDNFARFKAAGSKLVSPSMCKQADETWLAEFTPKITTPYDIVNVHINKKDLAGIQQDLDHYAQYGKPIWVTEFACVDDSTGFTPCATEAEQTAFVKLIVDTLQKDDRVAAYAISNGVGLGSWSLTDGSGGALSAVGQAYLDAIKQYA